MVSLVLAQVFIYALTRSSSEHPSLPSPDVSEISLPSSSSWAKPLISRPASRSFTPTLPNPSPCRQELADSSRCLQPPRCSGTAGLGGSCCSLGGHRRCGPWGLWSPAVPMQCFLGSQAQCYCASVTKGGHEIFAETLISSAGQTSCQEEVSCFATRLQGGLVQTWLASGLCPQSP